MDVALTDLEIQVIRQGGLYIAYSHALDLSTTGKSEAQAVHSLGKIIQIFMREVIRHEHERPGAFDQKLLDLGWTKRANSKRWSPPTVKSAVS